MTRKSEKADEYVEAPKIPADVYITRQGRARESPRRQPQHLNYQQYDERTVNREDGPLHWKRKERVAVRV
jgi:hypothetical protein